MCLANDLKKNAIDEDKCEDLFRIYEQEIGDDLREGIVIDDFEDFWEFEELKADEDIEDKKIKLNGDYTAIIPKSIFTDGLTISAIIEEIVVKIKS